MDPIKGRGIMKLRSLASSYLVAVVLGVAGMPAALLAASRIGLYTDQTGSTCSFSGNAPGLVTAYVMIHPDPNGVRALRFSAPLPACFGATFLYDSPPEGLAITGSSPTGVQMAFPSCAPYPEPTLALTITYYRNGSTTPCCAFPIEPDPVVGSIEITDCSFQMGSAAPVVSHFNADASCPCTDTTPPAPPTSPSPSNGATNVSMSTALAWAKNTLDIDIASYDVYFGTALTPPLVATVTQLSYQPAYLSPSTPYYWRIVIRDNDGNTTSGPTWSFTTRASNTAPTSPALVQPANGATDVLPNVTLLWTGSDVDNDPLRYDVYLGPSPNPVLVASNQSTASYPTSSLQFSTNYTWQVVVRDIAGAETTGPAWTFTTRPQNYPPATPLLSNPSNGATFLSNPVSLQWVNSDPDGDPITSNIYLGTTNPPPFHHNGSGSISTLTLATGTTYYWQIQANDSKGAFSAMSELRSFRTNALPTAPSNPSPANQTQNQPMNTTISWASTDADPGDIKFDIYAGNSPNPPLRQPNWTSNSYDVSQLTAVTQTFFWKIVAKDNHGASVAGPLWYFVVKANTAPDVPTNPTPPDNTYFNGTTITWEATDVDAPPQVLLWDVWFGSVNPPPQVQWQRHVTNYTPPFPLQPGTRYYWKISSWDSHVYTTSPTWSFVAGQPTATPELPMELALGRNHPNPFNPQTIIPYTVPKGAAMHVRIMVFDATGRRVRTLVDETQSAGAREVVWRGENEAGAVVSSGIYYCVMDAGGKRFTQKLVLLK